MAIIRTEICYHITLTNDEIKEFVDFYQHPIWNGEKPNIPIIPQWFTEIAKVHVRVY
jgi:hypothetical protein